MVRLGQERRGEEKREGGRERGRLHCWLQLGFHQLIITEIHLPRYIKI